MELEGVGFTADGADLSLERTDTGVRAMSKTPASVALRNARAAVCRGDDETMFAVHEVAAYKATKVETRVRVSDVTQTVQVSERAPFGGVRGPEFS